MNNSFPQVYDFEEAKQLATEYGTRPDCCIPQHLLLGNGFSMSLFDQFAYKPLFDAIKDKKELHRIKNIFEYLGISNFEGVLQLLQDCSKIGAIYGIDTAEIKKDYKVLKNALAEAIVKVHPYNTGEIATAHKESCIGFIKRFKNCFTVNYDLLLYWVLMTDDGDSLFSDLFTREADTPDKYCEYATSQKGDNNVYYLHGALHILQSRGRVFKLVWKTTGRPLIQQVIEAMDDGKYPMVVAEGTPESKLKQIKENQYLNFIFHKLGQVGGQFFTFGFSFSDQDQHIINSIATNRSIRHLWIGLRGNFERESNQIILQKAQEAQQVRIDILSSGKPPKNTEGDLSIHFYNAGDLDIWGKNLETS